MIKVLKEEPLIIDEPEQRLISAIIFQAVLDGCKTRQIDYNDEILADGNGNKEAARHWFICPTSSFPIYCELAGFDTDTVRKHALMAFEKYDANPVSRESRLNEK